MNFYLNTWRVEGSKVATLHIHFSTGIVFIYFSFIFTYSRSPGHHFATCFSAGAYGLPKLQYLSMMMSDSLVSESNKSLELNALALKYLQDEQLTELAQFTIHNNRQSKPGQASLLHQVNIIQ